MKTLTLTVLILCVRLFVCVPAGSQKIGALIELLVSRRSVVPKNLTADSTVKFVKGYFLNGMIEGAVEGQPQQIHPLELCINSPQAAEAHYGSVMIIKLEPISAMQPSIACSKIPFQINRGISLGASAVILITTSNQITDHQEISDWVFTRPVVIIDNPSEENKLFTILSRMSSAYIKINPISQPTLLPKVGQAVEYRPESTQTQKSATLFIIIGTSAGIVVLFTIVVFIVIYNLKKSHHYRSAGNVSRDSPDGLESAKLSSTRSHEKSEVNRKPPMSTYIRKCSVCHDDFLTNQEYRVLPCDHMLHVECAASWIKTQRVCPTCSANIITDTDETSSLRAASHHKSKRRRTNRRNGCQITEQPLLRQLDQPAFINENIEDGTNQRTIHVNQLVLTNIQT